LIIADWMKLSRCQPWEICTEIWISGKEKRGTSAIPGIQAEGQRQYVSLRVTLPLREKSQQMLSSWETSLSTGAFPGPPQEPCHAPAGRRR